MKTFRDLGDFGRFLMLKSIEIQPAISESLKLVADEYYNKVTSIIGDNAKLRPLEQSTQDERVKHGFTPNDPLLRTGDLRNSIEKVHGVMSSGVGTSNPKMLYHEYGFINFKTGASVPPRPAFQIALNETQTKNLQTIKFAVAHTLDIAESITHVGDVLLDTPPGI